MNNFTYYTPTKVIFGKDTEAGTGSLIREFGGSRVLLIYGGGSAIRSGLIGRVEKSLDDADLFHISLGGVKPNPRLSKVKEIIGLALENHIDFLLAVGGGSVIDTCKAAGYGIASPGLNVWDIYEDKVIPESCTPVGVILTIAAAGSEMSNSAVITNEDGWIKRGKSFDICRPKFSVLNPELTCTLPPYQTACGCTDIMMHTMERYFHNEKPADITDGIAEALMRDVVKYARILVDEPDNYDARAEIMWCGSLSHNGLTNAGGTSGDWSCHQLEHELSGLYDVAHGAGLAAVWPAWARYVCPVNYRRFAVFATRVMNVVPDTSDTDKTLSEKGIRAVKDFYHSIGMPANLKELGVSPTEEEFRTLVDKCTYQHTRTIGGCGIKELKEDDIEKIYRLAAGMS